MTYLLYTFIAVFAALQLDRIVTLVLGGWALRRMRAEREKQLKSQLETMMLEQSMESLRSGKTLPN